MYDLLIKGGQVVDPEVGYNGRFDVAVTRNRIAAVEKEIPADRAREVIDAAGQYVTPGLVDMHTHVYRGVTFWGIDADSYGSRSGITTVMDAGSAGAYTLPGFQEFIVKPAALRIYSFLNISAIGLVAPSHELASLDWCDVGLFESMAAHYRDLVVGVKVRVGIPQAPETSLEGLNRARQAADRTGLPVMVHVAWAPPRIEEVVALMKPGDILTHCFTGLSMKIVDEAGQPLEAVKRALDNGVILDIGHGKGSFSFEVAEAMLAAGVVPHVISTDAHHVSLAGPMFDLPTCMSKFLHLGLSFPEIIKAVTTRPAKAVGLYGEIGTIRPGAFADIALLRIDEGKYVLYDTLLQTRTATRLIRNTATILNGRWLSPSAAEIPPPYVHLSHAQESYYKTLEAHRRKSPLLSLDAPEDFGPAVPVERSSEPLPHERTDSSPDR